MQDNILEIKNLSKYFGGLAAVSNCSLKVKQGTITGIIGPNGSGKTTLFNLIAGNLKSSTGSVLFNNENITDVPSYELFSKGLLRTFQIAHEFTNLSVLENLMMVPGNQSGEKLINALLNPGLVAKEESQIKEKAMEVVDFLNLSHLKNELAGNLSGGQKKLLELGRTMMVDAKLVEAARQNGLQVNPWTVNNLERANQLVAIGVDGLITDVPGDMLKHLASKS